jgi:predicted TIM-barrel fold metal-dependent hydrolase
VLPVARYKERQVNATAKITVNQANLWRLETPHSSRQWDRSPYRGTDKNKYFMVSADAHLGPPATLIRDRIDPQYRDRVPRMERDKNGVLWMVGEGLRPTRIVDADMEGEDQYRSKAGSTANLEGETHNLDKRMADLDLDGIDAELVFPNGAALAGFWTKDPHLMRAQFRIYNDWVEELTRPYRNRMNVAACISTGDVESAVAEVQHAAKKGFRVITLPNKPVFASTDPTALNYNRPDFDPLWAAIQEADLTITFHVSTGADPRGATGPGGAVLNFAVYALTSTAEPVAHLCLSGALDRFPKLRFASIEAGVGWVPWLLDTMDEGYRKHHMWAFPKLKQGLPSEYFRAHGGASFGEDRSGIALMEMFGLEDNFCWANDYPHHEGTFPHSGEAIERGMNRLSEQARAKLLGLNAARLFRFEVPAAATV